jgi:hypothetical protein
MPNLSIEHILYNVNSVTIVIGIVPDTELHLSHDLSTIIPASQLYKIRTRLELTALPLPSFPFKVYRGNHLTVTLKCLLKPVPNQFWFQSASTCPRSSTCQDFDIKSKHVKSGPGGTKRTKTTRTSAAVANRRPHTLVGAKQSAQPGFEKWYWHIFHSCKPLLSL